MAAGDPFTPGSILTGFQGLLYDDKGVLIAEVNTFHGGMTVTNADYQAAGSLMITALLTGAKKVLTFTETVFRDTKFLGPVLAAIQAKKQPVFQFQATLNRADGSVGRYNFTDCVPDGEIPIMTVAPGQVIDRAWSWRVNGDIKPVNLLGT